jgi:hypothetical protein
MWMAVFWLTSASSPDLWFRAALAVLSIIINDISTKQRNSLQTFSRCTEEREYYENEDNTDALLAMFCHDGMGTSA